MIALHQYLLFVGACIVLSAVPGPDMLLVLTRSIAQGRRAGMITAVGINVGAYVHFFAAIAGLSALLAASAWGFTAIKWAGAAYLLYLGVVALFGRTGPLQLDTAARPAVTDRQCFWQGFWSDVLNPKVAIFYLALLPQFITPGRNVLAQLLLLGLTVNMIGILFNAGIVLFSAAITERLRQDPRISVWLSKALGAVFIALGLRLAVTKTV